MTYIPTQDRYKDMVYRRCGKSGILLPFISLGLWHNFGNLTPFGEQQSILRTAFDYGITHFDLANNYGPPYGEAEKNFGMHMEKDWHTHRDELIISTKAGYDMWKGPYGDHGSKKYLISSLDQSLKRMNLDYVDIFYHHRPDPDTPIYETMEALAQIVHSGKALYVGISNYNNPKEAKTAIDTLHTMGVPLLINQVNYSMFNRQIEYGLTEVMAQEGVGGIAFAPLQSGLLTDKYIHGIPSESRVVKDPRYLKETDITADKIDKIIELNQIASLRGQTLAQMAIAWTLRNPIITSALIGASHPKQIVDNIKAQEAAPFAEEELKQIDDILNR